MHHSIPLQELHACNNLQEIIYTFMHIKKAASGHTCLATLSILSAVTTLVSHWGKCTPSPHCGLKTLSLGEVTVAIPLALIQMHAWHSILEAKGCTLQGTWR